MYASRDIALSTSVISARISVIVKPIFHCDTKTLALGPGVDLAPPNATIGRWMEGSPCRMSIIRNGNVTMSILRKPNVTLSILRKHYVALSNLRKHHVACH